MSLTIQTQLSVAEVEWVEAKLTKIREEYQGYRTELIELMETNISSWENVHEVNLRSRVAVLRSDYTNLCRQAIENPSRIADYVEEERRKTIRTTRIDPICKVID